MANATSKGWQRLRIVLAIGWVVVTVAYITYDYKSINAAEGGWEDVEYINPEINKLPSAMYPHSLFTECGYKHQQPPTVCDLRLVNVWGLLVGPILLGWILIVAGRWIAAGFRDNGNDQHGQE